MNNCGFMAKNKKRIEESKTKTWGKCLKTGHTRSVGMQRDATLLLAFGLVKPLNKIYFHGNKT